jgi:arginase
VIWIDAHGDMMTHKNTLSGNIHGMPSAVAFGVGHPKLTSVYEEKIKVLPENMLYIGLKDLDQAEIDLIREKNITAFTIFDILENSWSPIFAAIKAMAARVDRVWVSLDIDSIDQIFAPATPMVNNGGLTYREITNLARYIGKVVPLAGVDIVEFAPALDVENTTAKLILELIAGLCGAEYGWYQHYMQQEMNKQTER